MKQKKLMTSIFISASLLSANAFAHLSYKGEAMPITITAPHNWTGFYVGLNAGIVQHTMNITDVQATSFNATIQQSANPGLTGGLQLGYRRQLDLASASGVYGIEFSANFSNTTFQKDYGSPFALYQFNSKNELNNVCLLQLTGGIAADKTLLFFAAGLSRTSLSGSTNSLNGAPFFNSFNVSKNQFGTAFGGGAEYAFTKSVSARFKIDAITPNTYSTSDATNDSFQISNTMIQGALGINYTFG